MKRYSNGEEVEIKIRFGLKHIEKMARNIPFQISIINNIENVVGKAQDEIIKILFNKIKGTKIKS